MNAGAANTSGRRIRDIALGIAVSVALYLVGSVVVYSSTNRQYEKLVKENPKTREEVERTLRWYLSRDISVEGSRSGSYRCLAAGEEVRQYLILGIGSIEVVYRGELVVSMFPSYE